MTARLNYLAADRVDIQFAVKELTRRMSRPTQRDMTRIKRVARYLKGAPRVVQSFVPGESAKIIRNASRFPPTFLDVSLGGSTEVSRGYQEAP